MKDAAAAEKVGVHGRMWEETALTTSATPTSFSLRASLLLYRWIKISKERRRSTTCNHGVLPVPSSFLIRPPLSFSSPLFAFLLCRLRVSVVWHIIVGRIPLWMQLIAGWCWRSHDVLSPLCTPLSAVAGMWSSGCESLPAEYCMLEHFSSMPLTVVWFVQSI